jgi:hypothetical protein
MLEKTFKLFNDTMKMFEEEVKGLSKSIFKGKTKIKIKKDSLIYINGVKARLLTDVVVSTDEPDKLMK